MSKYYELKETLQNCFSSVSFEKMTQDCEGLRVTFKNENLLSKKRIIVFDFGYSSLLVRNSYEGALVNYRDTPQKDKKGCFFVGEDTELVKWFQGSSGGIYSDEKILHFILFSSDFITEVLSINNPKIKFLE